jgi:biotin carboxylase
MHVLVLQRPQSTARYDHWIRQADPNARVTVLTSADTVRPDADLAPDVRRVRAADYRAAATMADVFRVCATDRPDRVFANAEEDVLRAAEARTLFGIPGQTSHTALLFRDKVRMKRLFAGLGVPAVPYRSPRCIEELFSAQRQFGALVVKPRDGAGAVGVRVLSTAADVRRVCAQDVALVAALHAGALIAERYVDGAVHHVDMLVDGARPLLVSPSRYTSPPHLFGTDNLGSVMLDGDSRRARVLEEIARKFVRLLPVEHGVHVLHLEFLEDASGALFAGEVACRVGGAMVREGIRHTYGVDISQLACLLSTGLWPDAVRIGRAGPPTAWLRWNGGPELAVPAERPTWLVAHATAERAAGPSGSVDGKASFLVEGTDEKELRTRLRALSVRR